LSAAGGAAGQTDIYTQYYLKPWDVAAGIVILEEAGGRVTTCDGAAYSVFDRSLLATNDALYEQVGLGPGCSF
jgi:myo-inositol-1(or 4)-monophosphatase